MKKIALLTIAIILPFMHCEGVNPKNLPTAAKQDGWYADAGKHFAEPAAEKIASAMDKTADKIENSTNRVCDTIEEVPDLLGHAREEAEKFVAFVGFIYLTGYGIYKVGEYTAYGASNVYRYMNGTLDAHKAEQRRLEEEANRKAEEERLKALIAVQEAARLKRNAEIETEFNQCYMNRFSSPTRKRNGIPSGCELQGFQLVSTGKFKSMEELKEYYRS